MLTPAPKKPGGLKKGFLRPFGPQFGLKKREGGPPRAPPLNPPIRYRRSVRKDCPALVRHTLSLIKAHWRMNRPTDRRILKIFLLGFRIQSEILTPDLLIWQWQRIADSSIFEPGFWNLRV